MRSAPLAAFVLGVCALQGQANLPPRWAVVALFVLALVLGAAAERSRGGLAVGLACGAALAAGFTAWMMAPHHGSRTPSSSIFLDAVQPGHAVAQMG